MVASLILNVRFYIAHTKLVGFLDEEYDKIQDDYRFFERMTEKHLLMNDSWVVAFNRRVRATKDRYGQLKDLFPHSQV